MTDTSLDAWWQVCHIQAVASLDVKRSHVVPPLCSLCGRPPVFTVADSRRCDLRSSSRSQPAAYEPALSALVEPLAQAFPAQPPAQPHELVSALATALRLQACRHCAGLSALCHFRLRWGR
jgi:hypothetical protein